MKMADRQFPHLTMGLVKLSVLAHIAAAQSCRSRQFQVHPESPGSRVLHRMR
jgi:hypothetical protein